MANAVSVGYVELPSNVPLIQETVSVFFPRKKKFLQMFAGTTVMFLGAPEDKMRFMNHTRPATKLETNMAFCDTPTTRKFGVPEFDEREASYHREGTFVDACSLQPLVTNKFIPATTMAAFNAGEIDPYAAMYIMEQSALLIGEKGWEKARDYYLGHLTTFAAALAISGIPGISRVGTMQGIIGQVAVLLNGAGRAINTAFGGAPLGTDAVINEMDAMIARQGIAGIETADPGTPYFFHITKAAADNFAVSILKKGINTTLFQQQTLDGSTYRVDSYRNIKIIVHPEWDEVLTAESRQPNMILLANSNQIGTYAPDPRIAPAGFFPYVYQQGFINKANSLEKMIAQEYEFFGGAVVGGEATGFELSV